MGGQRKSLQKQRRINNINLLLELNHFCGEGRFWLDDEQYTNLSAKVIKLEIQIDTQLCLLFITLHIRRSLK